MIDYQVLRRLVLEAIKVDPRTQYGNITHSVKQLAVRYDVFPTEEECRERKINYGFYREKRLNPIDLLNVNQIIWDLIVDRVLTVGMDSSNDKWPFLRLTEFGQSVAEQTSPTYYDPEGYVAKLSSLTPKLDSVIKQYVLEGLHCFRQRLFFAAAVMFGAAVEKAILLLLESIANAEADQKKSQKLIKLLNRPNLSEIFSAIQSRLDTLKKAKTIPYSIHQSSTEHLLSLFEMIRVQRNDAVHPAAAQVNKTKVFLTIQAIPSALEVLYRLMNWFKKNQI